MTDLLMWYLPVPLPPSRPHTLLKIIAQDLILKQYRISMLFIFSHLTYFAFLLTFFHIINIT